MSQSMQDFTACYDRSHQPQCALCVPGTQTLGRMSAWEFRTHLPVSEVRSKRGKLGSESLWTAPTHQPSGAGSCPGGASDVEA